MVKQSKKNICILIVWSIIYVMICSALVYLIRPHGGFSHKTSILVFSISISSMLICVILLFGYMKFDGSNNTWWSRLLYDIFPYSDKEKRGTISYKSLDHHVLFDPSNFM